MSLRTARTSVLSSSEPPEALVRPHHFASAYLKAEKGAVQQARGPTLLAVDHQPEPDFDEPSDALHDPLCGLEALDQDEEVVGITRKAQPPPFQFLVQWVQHDIGQQRRERAALRHPLGRSFHF